MDTHLFLDLRTKKAMLALLDTFKNATFMAGFRKEKKGCLNSETFKCKKKASRHNTIDKTKQ